MNAFTALDEVLNTSALAAGPARVVTPAAGFQPLFAQALAPRDEAQAAPMPHGESQIELVEENGRVRQIVVTCGCGERTVIECAY